MPGPAAPPRETFPGPPPRQLTSNADFGAGLYLLGAIVGLILALLTLLVGAAILSLIDGGFTAVSGDLIGIWLGSAGVFLALAALAFVLRTRSKRKQARWARLVGSGAVVGGTVHKVQRYVTGNAPRYVARYSFPVGPVLYQGYETWSQSLFTKAPIPSVGERVWVLHDVENPTDNAVWPLRR